MNLLAIDTVSQTVSVTADGPRGRCTISFASKIQHAETLLSLMDTALEQAGFTAGETGLVLCAEGPGSFTGLRIAFAAAKGVQLASDCPLVPVPTLTCYAEQFRAWKGSLLSVLDAKKKRFYVQLFSNGAPAGEVRDCSAEEAVESLDPSLPLIITGPDAGLFAASLGTVLNTGQFTVIPCGTDGISRTMVEIALRERTDYTGNRDDYSAPIYVRKSDAETAR